MVLVLERMAPSFQARIRAWDHVQAPHDHPHGAGHCGAAHKEEEEGRDNPDVHVLTKEGTRSARFGQLSTSGLDRTGSNKRSQEQGVPVSSTKTCNDYREVKEAESCHQNHEGTLNQEEACLDSSGVALHGEPTRI